jgi:drug/metabolite transporter (DMT)-like permease
MSAPTWLGPALLLVGATAIGFAPIGLRLSEFGPQATAFWRFLFALPMIAAVIYALGGRIRRPTWLSLAAGVFFGLDIAFWHQSLNMTSVANATFLVNLGNVSVGLIVWLVLKERPAKIWPWALAVALVGALLLSRGAAAETTGELQGDALALLAAVMVGLYLFFAKLARRTETALNVLFWTTLASLCVSAAAAVATRENLVPVDASWLLVPLALAVIAQVAGQGLIVAGVGRTPAALAGLLLLVQPVMAALIAWLIFGEDLAPVQIGGAALILFGVWLAGRR